MSDDKWPQSSHIPPTGRQPGSWQADAFEQIILHYGVVAILLGAGIEGEPFALAGGILAHRQWVSPYLAALASIGGACLIDQLWFHLSRHFRQSRIVQRIGDRPAFRRSQDLIERHPVWFVLLFRFAYGLRAVAPVAIGASRVSVRLFVPLNICAAIVWGLLFTGLGYGVGPACESYDCVTIFAADLEQYEKDQSGLEEVIAKGGEELAPEQGREASRRHQGRGHNSPAVGLSVLAPGYFRRTWAAWRRGIGKARPPGMTGPRRVTSNSIVGSRGLG